jgi:pectin methylesterase-like acyl-CoA thioesterase
LHSYYDLDGEGWDSQLLNDSGEAAPNNRSMRMVIRVNAGAYKVNVEVSMYKMNIVLVSQGMTCR